MSPQLCLRLTLGAAALLAGATSPAVATAAAPLSPPRAIPLTTGWEIRDVEAAAPAPQPPPPPEGEVAREGGALASGRARGAQAAGPWRPTPVPSVFDPDARPELYGGTVKRYRLRFTAPKALDGVRWAFHFESVRRVSTVFLNGRRIGFSLDPYSPFMAQARGLRPGKVNVLEVQVDNRKDPKLPEGWWNWGGIVRPVKLVPLGRADVRELGLMSDVICRLPGRSCKTELLIDGMLQSLPREQREVKVVGKGRKKRVIRLPLPQPTLTVRLKTPKGKLIRKTFQLEGRRTTKRRIQLRMAIPGANLWSPENPQLYGARVTVKYKGARTQIENRRIGMRSVEVKGGRLFLNNREVNLRGASIHEDMPVNGAALSPYDMDTIVRELKEIGANTTRAHYLMNEGLLRRFDKAGILVWNQAPVWQRDVGNQLGLPIQRKRGYDQVAGAVKAARSHPSVITHSVANELSLRPDGKPATRIFLKTAAAIAKDLDPTLPISTDIKSQAGLEEQFAYEPFELLGINQYFGWYGTGDNFALLGPYLQQMRDNYPDKALVMTEFGAEGRPDLADADPSIKGSYGYQDMHIARTLDLFDTLPYYSGALHWTLREFEIFPGWRGGAVNGPGRNTRHHKAVLTYDGQRKPSWQVLADRIARVPLYR